MQWRMIVVVGLAVLAGCGAFSNADPAEATVTPVPISETTTSTAPPGLSGDGVESAAVLANAHEQVVSGQSYVWHQRSVEIVRVNGSMRRLLQRNETITVENDTVYRREERQLIVNHRLDSHRWTNRSTYADGDREYMRRLTVGPGQPFNFAISYVEEGHDSFGAEAESVLRRSLTLENASITRVERDGNQWYSVVGSGSNWPGTSDARDFRVAAVVTEDGLVRRLSVEYTIEESDSRVRAVRYSFRYAALGNASASRPAWLSENVTR
jgi:hypothetical protein